MADQKTLLEDIKHAVEQGNWGSARTFYSELDRQTDDPQDKLLRLVLNKAIEIEDKDTAKSILQVLRLIPPLSDELVRWGTEARMKQLERWSALIGRLLMSFGEVEALTHVGLKILPKDPIFKAVANMRFSSRADLLKTIILGRRGECPTLVDMVAERLETAKKLAEKRNFIAHNPLRMSIYEDEAGRHKFVEEISHHTSAAHKVSYEELSSYVLEVATLEVELGFVMDLLFKTLVPGHTNKG